MDPSEKEQEDVEEEKEDGLAPTSTTTAAMRKRRPATPMVPGHFGHKLVTIRDAAGGLYGQLEEQVASAQASQRQLVALEARLIRNQETLGGQVARVERELHAYFDAVEREWSDRKQHLLHQLHHHHHHHQQQQLHDQAQRIRTEHQKLTDWLRKTTELLITTAGNVTNPGNATNSFAATTTRRPLPQQQDVISDGAGGDVSTVTTMTTTTTTTTTTPMAAPPRMGCNTRDIFRIWSQGPALKEEFQTQLLQPGQIRARLLQPMATIQFTLDAGHDLETVRSMIQKLGSLEKIMVAATNNNTITEEY